MPDTATSMTAMKQSFSEDLVDLLLDFPVERIPQRAIEAALRCIEDTVGVAIAAAAIGTATEGARIAAPPAGPGAVIWGFGRSGEPAAAALANGMLAHGLDFDDTHPAAIMHASAVNVPVALALAEDLQIPSREMLGALVLSYEVSARLGRLAAGPFQDRGFQSTAVLGIFAATFLAARLHRVSRVVAVNAMGIAGSMASGLMEYLSDGSNTKQLHAGWAAQSGIQALRLAAAGLTGPKTVLEGRFGVYRAYAALEIDPTAVLAPPDDSFEVELMAPKPYPACLCVHAIVQGGLDLHRRGLLTRRRLAEIEDLHCEVPPWYVNLVFEPRAAKAAPETAYDGRFSASFCLARAGLDGYLSPQSFEDSMLRDPIMRSLAAKVTYTARPFEEFPASFPALVRLRLQDGSTHESFVPYNLGSAKAPFSVAQIEDKFRQNVEAIGAAAANRLHRAIIDLPRDENCAQLWSALAAARVDRLCGQEA